METHYRLGIDFGTTYSCVGVWKNGGIEIIPNEIGERTTPSVVIFDSPQKVFVGEETFNHISKKNSVKIYEIKRLIGKKYSEVEDILKYFSFEVIKDENQDKPLIKIRYENNESKTYTPELIASLIIKKLINNAQSYLNGIIKEIIITVPADFTHFQKCCIKFAVESINDGIKVISIINEPSAAVLSYGFPKQYLKQMFFPFNNRFTLLNDLNNIVFHPMEEDIDNEKNNVNENILKFSLKTSFLNQNKEDLKIIVFDFGGGTFDVSLIEVTDTIFETRASAGNQHLGGGDLDNKLMDYCLEFFNNNYNIPIEDIKNNYKYMERLKMACEQTKKILSIKDNDTIYIEDFYDQKVLNCSITRAKFENICKDLFDKLIPPLDRVLLDSKITNSQIDEIILVGGSSKIPKIKEILKDKFPNSNINESISPDEAVAYGATIWGESLIRNTGNFWENFGYLDSTQHSYGIEIEDGTMEIIIPRGSQYPTSIRKYFFNAYDYQYTFDIKVYEGEKPKALDNDLLSEFIIRDIPKKKKGELVLEITFAIDNDQILNVSGYVAEGNIKSSVKIDKKDPLKNDGNTKLILGKISIMGDDLSKEEKRLKIEIMDYSKQFKKMRNDDDKYNLIKNYNNALKRYLSLLEEKYNDIISEKYLFLVDKLFKSYSYFYKTQLISFIDINEKSTIENIIKTYIEKICKNNPFRLRQLLIHFQDIKRNKSEIYYKLAVYSMDLLKNKGDEFCFIKEKISLQTAKNIYEESLFIGKIFEKDNILYVLNDNEVMREYNYIKEYCETKIKIISADSFSVIENTKNYGKLFSNEKNLDYDNLCLLSYILNQTLKNLNDIVDLKENEEGLEAKCICLANIVKIEKLKRSGTLNIKKTLELCEESINIADKLGEKCTNRDWYREIKGLQEQFIKTSNNLIPAPSIEDMEEIKQELTDKSQDPDEFLKYLLTKYPIEGCEYSDIIEKYNENKRKFFVLLKQKYTKIKSLKISVSGINNNNLEELKKHIVENITNCINFHLNNN